MDDTEILSVAFVANIDSLTAVPSMIDSIFQNVASSAESSGSDITASMESATESFSALSEGAAQISVGVEEGVAGAVEALDQLPSVGEEAGSSLAESVSQASSGFSSLEDAVNALADSVNVAVGEINTQIDSIGTNAEESASTAQSAGDGFNLGGMVSQVGMGIFSLQAMGQMAASTAMGLLGPASAAENTQASFSNLLGTTQAASTELGKLNDFAAKTQFKTQDIDNAASSMIAFKLPTQSIIPDLTAVGDALTAVGKGTAPEMQSVVDILGKMSVQGKLTQGDITQLGAHGINAMDAIVAGSGKSQAAIEDMVKKGTLPAKDAIDDLTKGIEKNPVYSGGMAKQADTLGGQMSTLKSTWDQAMASFGSPVIQAVEPLLGQIGTAISSPSFKDFAGSIGKNIVVAFKDIGGAVQNAGQFFDNPSFKALATLLSGQLATGIKDLAKYFDSPAFGHFAKVVGADVGGALLDVTKDIEGMVNFVSSHQDAMNALGAGIGGIGAVILAVAIPAFIGWAIAMGPVVLEALLLAAPFILLGIVVGAVIFGVIEAVQHWSEITKVVGGVVGNVIGAVGGFFNNVGGVIHNITGGINDAFTAMGKTISEVWDGAVGGVKGAINTIIDDIDGFIGFIDSIQIHIPSITVGPVSTPAFDWNGVGIPKIPHLSTGGSVPPGGFAVAGDPGPNSELVYGGTSGLSVFSHAQSSALMGDSGSSSGGGNTTHVHIHFDGQEMASFMVDPLMNKVVKMIRMQGGKVLNI
jgi:tape measure domain-containing protein